VPPFPGELARASLERSYGCKLDELFTAFSIEPLAAASIAQVHVATRRDGREVVVKVLRPGMRAQIGRDLEVMDAMAALAERWWPEARRLRPIEVVRDYRQTVLDELDLMREAANASQLRRNFAASQLLYVPEVHWDLCRGDVMVMERIHGVPIGDLATLRARGTDFKRLAENGVEIFFTQVFRHNFFHADMHPGNIFVMVDDPAAPRYAAVDFGIIGTLAVRDQRYLAEIFLAVFDRDYRRVAALHIECGWVPPATRVDEMESAVRTICEPIFDRPLGEISFGTVLLRLFAALQRFDGQIQPQLILLQKTLLNVEGLGRQLYPELDIWKTAAPVLRAWQRERMSPRTLLRELRRGLPDVLAVLTSWPALARAALERASADKAGEADPQQASQLAAAAAAAATAAAANDARRREHSTVAAILLIGGLLWLGLRIEPQWTGGLLAVGGLAALLFRA
jgi:ubiquinone biosynthesis protein